MEPAGVFHSHDFTAGHVPSSPCIVEPPGATRASLRQGGVMHAIAVSIIGVAVTDVRHGITTSGVPIARFRMVSQPRRYDSNLGSFVDMEASYVTVVSWRNTADNIAASIHKGDPVVVVGKLRVREFESDGRTRIAVEVDAQSVGHDLSRGSSRFSRALRPVEGGVASHVPASHPDQTSVGAHPGTYREAAPSPVPVGHAVMAVAPHAAAKRGPSDSETASSQPVSDSDDLAVA